jgi:hypothetical protein
MPGIPVIFTKTLGAAMALPQSGLFLARANPYKEAEIAATEKECPPPFSF